MKINKIKIENFKFHKSLEFTINGKNSLIYGENGTGKSSIYWALASVFKSTLVNDINKYKNYNTQDEPFVEIEMNTNDTLIISENNQAINDSFNTIYFLDQNFLEEIIREDSLYEVFENSLSLQFKKINEMIKIINNFNEEINAENHTEISTSRQNKTNEYYKFLNNLISISNKIINNNFRENFIVSFDINWGESNTLVDYKFSKPIIKLKINDKDDIAIYFNEAKLKLTALAIVFALIKMEENLQNQIKLLVLDDFLTSLDMGNRKFIVDYIIKEFNKYQIMLLTHNLQFFNLIKRYINHYSLTNKWDIKNICLIENNYMAMIYDKNSSYLDEAKQKLNEGEYRISGNLARKEFERIANELKQLLEIGKQEELQTIIDSVKSNVQNKIYFKEPFKVLKKLYNNIERIKEVLNQSSPDSNKISQIKNGIDSLNLEQFDENLMQSLKQLIHNTTFYKDMLFNPSSHNNEDIEIFKKECKGGISLLEEMNRILEQIKK